MSQENVEKIMALLEPFDDAEITGIDWEDEAIGEILERDYSPDIELRTLESGIGIGPSSFYKGWDGLIRYFREWFEPFREYRMKWLDYVEAGERVLYLHDEGVGRWKRKRAAGRDGTRPLLRASGQSDHPA